MIENDSGNIQAAFEMLVEEVEAQIDFVNRIGARAMESRDYARAREALEYVGRLTAFRDKVVALRAEWEELLTAAQHQEDETRRTERRYLGRLQKGQRTPASAYRVPILRALDEMGGRGRMQQVLDRAGAILGATLKDVDYQPLPSEPETPRWRNAARWQRYIMVQEGLLKKDSPRGVWEITDAGRAYLRHHGTSP